jgi:galactose mutarotase-like enzyme
MLRYVLRARSIKLEAVLENKGPTPAPFSFGYHPYFYFEDRQGVEVHLPCRDRVTLNPQLLIPEGSEALASNVITLDATTTYDNVFGTMTGRQALVVDKKTGRTIRIDVDEAIENLVIYSPAGSKFVCLEPWTKGLGAFSSLNQDDWQKGERINVLKPGQSRTITVSYTVEGSQAGYSR